MGVIIILRGFKKQNYFCVWILVRQPVYTNFCLNHTEWHVILVYRTTPPKEKAPSKATTGRNGPTMTPKRGEPHWKLLRTGYTRARQRGRTQWSGPQQRDWHWLGRPTASGVTWKSHSRWRSRGWPHVGVAGLTAEVGSSIWILKNTIKCHRIKRDT